MTTHLHPTPRTPDPAPVPARAPACVRATVPARRAPGVVRATGLTALAAVTAAVLAALAPVTATALPPAGGGAPTSTVSTATDRAVPKTVLNPGQLERGAGPRVPRVLGTSIVDGSLEVPVDADEIDLLGPAGDDYVVVAYDASGGVVERVSPDGSTRVLRESNIGLNELSSDGSQLFDVVTRGRDRTVVRVLDTTTGEVTARRGFPGFVDVLDAADGVAVLGGTAPRRTISWDTATDETTRIVSRQGYRADLAADRLSTFSGDPYDGGCSRITPLSDPARTLWRSCDDIEVAASPGAGRLLTVPLLLDGPLSEVAVRGAAGRLLGGYGTRGTFGPLVWEDDRTALITVYGVRRTAVVRCTVAGPAEDRTCERATRLIPTPGL
ncbi:hypothetical protein [Nocardioides sp. Leaf285]|uniref:hypothetical protein n=1 Tax=Nocardioides sp. Leaf285 TaxID=1736322 RepID=UPI000B2687FC|nr:hypothetical protein [Nocardioides sp. Leaf285]